MGKITKNKIYLFYFLYIFMYIWTHTFKDSISDAYIYIYIRAHFSNFMVPGRWNPILTPCKLKTFRVKMSRRNKKGNYMWVPQK